MRCVPLDMSSVGDCRLNGNPECDPGRFIKGELTGKGIDKVHGLPFTKPPVPSRKTHSSRRRLRFESAAEL